MFKGLSESRDFPRGKKMSEISYTSRHQQFEIGYPSWQQSYVSAYNYLHDRKPILDHKKNLEPRNKSHFTLCQNENEKYYTSEKTAKYVNNFDKLEKNKKLNKQEVLKTTLILGTDKENLATHYQQIYDDKSNIVLPSIKWKPQRERYDIITNNEIQKERKNIACAFDYWNANKDKKRISRNFSEIPKDHEVINVLTGKYKKNF